MGFKVVVECVDNIELIYGNLDKWPPMTHKYSLRLKKTKHLETQHRP